MAEKVLYRAETNEVLVVEGNKTWFAEDLFWKTKRYITPKKAISLRTQKQVVYWLKKNMKCVDLGKL